MQPKRISTIFTIQFVNENFSSWFSRLSIKVFVVFVCSFIQTLDCSINIAFRTNREKQRNRKELIKLYEAGRSPLDGSETFPWTSTLSRLGMIQQHLQLL